MVEPIREVLDAGLQSDTDERDDRWVNALREDVMDAEVDLECNVVEKQISLRDIVDLRPGDIIPINMPDFHVCTANGVPLFKTQFGQSNENLALKVLGQIERPQKPKEQAEIGENK